MAIGTTLVARLDARDRALFVRCALESSSSRAARVVWTLLTHVGGATCSIAAAVLPLLTGGALAGAARHALATLVVSHLVVQVVKRTVGRPRPSLGVSCASLVAEPDRFSFPSGHAAAAFSVSIAYATAYPPLAAPLLGLAGPEGAGVVCDPFGIGTRGAAEDPFHLAGDGRRPADLPRVPGHQGLDERLGEAMLDHARHDRLGRDLLAVQPPAEHVADRRDRPLVRDGSRAGQLQPSAQ